LRIGVVGGGAIGLITAGYLSEYFPVTLYVRRSAQKELLQREGLDIINGPGSITNLTVKTSRNVWDEDLIVLAVKQPDIPSLLQDHSKPARPRQALLFLQNGASHLDYLDQLDYEHMFIGIVEHGAWKKSDNTVVQRGFGQIKLGVVRGDRSVISPLLSIKAFPFTIVTNWRLALDEKLLINSVVNPLTGLYRVPNGRLVSNPHYFKIMKMVFREVMTVLDFEDTDKEWNHLLQVCQNTKENRSSMLQDIEAKKITELDAILGVIRKRAELKNTPVPVIQFLYESIKGIEKTYLNEM
jgi:2-dehydropantoate 2-reductase